MASVPCRALWITCFALGLAACGGTPPVAPDAGCADCVCQPGETVACYPGQDGTAGVGACAAGVQTCGGDGQWGDCEGAVLPAGETCNGEDDDCDGEVDDGFGEVTCGVGACEVTVTSCVDGGTVACEPLRPAVRDACDGLDDDCDGEVDEGCACLDGQTRPCYGGPAQTAGVGLCAEGVQTCAGGQWGGCQGEVLPATETCNGGDDDCDGATDEEDPFLGADCPTGQDGVCAEGTWTCEAGLLVCQPLRQPVQEACNGADDDCDGATDEGGPGAGQPCGTGLQGLCADGITACQNEGLVCNPKNTAQPELCDGEDNDCDGVSDEGDPGAGQPCTTGLPGECAAGTTTCGGGAPGCAQNVQAQAETCDGLDNDCDGTPDDAPVGLGQPCTTSLPGACSAGATTCAGGAVVCEPLAQPQPETCDGADNDCDGPVDEGNPGGGTPCSTGQPGVCGPGLSACAGGVITCVQQVQPSAETCDGQDNDCDGAADNGDPGGGAACSTGLPGACAPGTSACNGGQLQCEPDSPPQAETCDGVDNDCDGTEDDGDPGGGLPCNTGLLGECAQGVTACSSGTVTCQQLAQPALEICDGRDNDCDGQADDGNPGAGAPCGTGQPGVCAAGTSACSGGVPICVQDQQPSQETCNTLDDDCDGQADEDFDLNSDPNHCGSCGNVCGTAAGALCCNAACVIPGPTDCGACGLPCSPGMLVINEVLLNPNAVADSQGEWFEVHNPGSVDVDLRGFQINDLGLDTHTVTSSLPVKVPAGGLAVLGINANTTTNGGVSVLYQYSSVFLGNSSDELILVDVGGGEVDRIEWTSGFVSAGASKELSVNHQTAGQNDAAANWCPATAPFGAGDLGSPGAVNACAK